VIRVVADANVLVSAVLARSPNSSPAIVLDAAIEGRVELVTSPMLLTELADVLRRPRFRPYLSLDEAEHFIAGLAGQSALTQDAPLPHPSVCRDPKDDYLVALTLKAKADALVTGDRDLLEMESPSVTVVTPRQLADRLRAASEPG
jgi:putative PIN family toxin of toxin-antitoxin system